MLGGSLREESVQLKSYIDLARALQSASLEEWQKVPRGAISRMLIGVGTWLQAPGRDMPVGVPEVVRRKSSIPSYLRLAPTAAILWALTGVHGQDPVAALLGTR